MPDAAAVPTGSLGSVGAAPHAATASGGDGEPQTLSSPLGSGPSHFPSEKPLQPPAHLTAPLPPPRRVSAHPAPLCPMPVYGRAEAGSGPDLQITNPCWGGVGRGWGDAEPCPQSQEGTASPQHPGPGAPRSSGTPSDPGAGSRAADATGVTVAGCPQRGDMWPRMVVMEVAAWWPLQQVGGWGGRDCSTVSWGAGGALEVYWGDGS